MYGQMTRLWGPFRGSEIVLKLTEGPKNRPEAFCGALRLSVSCSSHADSAVRINRPEMMLDRSSSIASTLGSLERERRVVKATRLELTIKHRFWLINMNG